MSIIWSPRATQEFQAQVRWLETARGQRQASHHLEDVLLALEKITHPQAAYQLVRTDPETRCCRVNRHIKLYYRPQAEGVELVTFFDTLQNPDKLKI